MKLFPALEDSGSNKQQETEVVLYTIIGDHEGLKQADSAEHHVQVERKLKDGTRQRIRKISKTDSVQYLFTIKTKNDTDEAVNSFTEQTTEVTEEDFNKFKEEADRVIYKTRFNFKASATVMTFDRHGDSKEITIPDVLYEIDVFENEEAVRGKWCKIDIEVDGILTYIKEHFPFVKEIKLRVKVSHLPFNPKNIILVSDTTPEQDALLSHLWDTQFAYPLK